MLKVLYREHKKWVSMLAAMGCPEHLREDFVHDMYIKIGTMDNASKIMYNDTEANHFYVYLTLRSVFYSAMKGDKSYSVDPDDIVIEYEPEDNEFEEGWDKLYNDIIQETNKFGRYGSKLTQVYLKTDKSIRTMAEESGISTTSIFNSLKQYKAHLREAFKEDWEDFTNGDYDKI